MNFHAPERIAVFIDGANLHASARALGLEIDYRKLLEIFANSGRLVRAFYYTALYEVEDHSPLRPLVDWLEYNGYTAITKPAKEFTDAMGNRRIPGDAITAGEHSEAEWRHTTAQRRGHRGQDRPEGRGDDNPDADLRGGVPGVQLRVPAGAWGAQYAGRARGRTYTAQDHVGGGL